MWLKKKNKGAQSPKAVDNAAQWIAGCIVSCQIRICKMLGRWEQGLNNEQKKYLLLAFCLLFGGYCLFTLLDAITRKEPKQLNPERFIKSSDHKVMQPLPHSPLVDSASLLW